MSDRPVVILGGLDSVLGAIVGGLVIGVLENLSGGYLDPLFGGGVELAEVLPLTEVQQAHQLSESGHTRGKIVLTVGT